MLWTSMEENTKGGLGEAIKQRVSERGQFWDADVEGGCREVSMMTGSQILVRCYSVIREKNDGGKPEGLRWRAFGLKSHTEGS